VLFLDGKVNSLPVGDRFISVITEMELLAFPQLTDEAEEKIRIFLSGAEIIPLTGAIKDEAIRIRRFASPHLKLPDAIIAATTVILEAVLVTNDATILNLNWNGLILRALT
jgi:predicted nucleic acid-binding protein